MPEQHTRKVLQDFSASLPADDGTDAANVGRGFLGTRAEPIIERDQPMAWQSAAFDLSRSDFVTGAAPSTVNPALWRQAGFNAQHGLYEVCEGIWQVRGFDISTVTFIAGDTGWIIIDPLTTAETARAAFALVTEHLGQRPVKAVIYTHSHVDHYGGILGVISPEQATAGEIPIVAPEGFMAEAVSENIIAGPAMGRRAIYQFGILLPWDETGHVDTGLGKGGRHRIHRFGAAQH
jgi:Alkyl sulfatase and related hydrolases